MIKHVEDIAVYKEEIKEGLVLVDFFATWCGPCNMLAPVIENLVKEHEELKVIKVDVDEAQEIAYQFGIQSIPTLLLYKDGQIVNRGLGYMNKNQLENFISK